MPISFAIRTRRVHTVATDTVNYEQAMTHLRAKAAAQLLDAPELFDARNATFALTCEEVRLLAEELWRQAGPLLPGPVAVVTGSGFVKGLAETYAALTSDLIPHFRICTQLENAIKWLESLPGAKTGVHMGETVTLRSER